MADDRKPTCFFLSPIGEEGTSERATADKVLKHLIVKVLGDDYEILRADGDSNPGSITPRIVTSIMEARLIVADLSGFNPNVFYELAVSHGFRKPVVHIQKASEKPAFDVKDMRTVRYDISDPDALETAQGNLAKFAKHAVEQPQTVETPLTSSVKFAEIEASGDPVAESNVQVLEAIEQLRYEIRRINRLPSRIQAEDRRSNSAAAADNRALRRIVARIVEDGRAEVSDFEGVITESTSGSHDNFVEELLKEATGEDDDNELRGVLYDDATARRYGLIEEDILS